MRSKHRAEANRLCLMRISELTATGQEVSAVLDTNLALSAEVRASLQQHHVLLSRAILMFMGLHAAALEERMAWRRFDAEYQSLSEAAITQALQPALDALAALDAANGGGPRESSGHPFMDAFRVGDDERASEMAEAQHADHFVDWRSKQAQQQQADFRWHGSWTPSRPT